uniref:NADH dehydrogenase subunit 6 n=1 Tax=Dermacentor sinicus TaxID=1131252 RepID=UPI001FAFF354|nr:NADH dehydrogenase subunit 6 [Dermacentor sinicus]UNO54103.1 NADH dehydrogenase subunit 6 [Dermacentor sinicus]
MLFSEIKMIIMMSILCMSMSNPISMLISLILLTLFLSISFYFLFQFSLISLLMILIILGGMLIIFMYMISLCPNYKIIVNKKMIMFSIFMTSFISFPTYMMNFEMINMSKIYLMNFTNMLIMMMIFLIISLMIISKNLNWINCPIKKYN